MATATYQVYNIRCIISGMLNASMLNNRLIDMKYAVRGPIVQRAQELEAQGREIIYCNIGNPQALGQHPLTYIRQTLALIEFPELMNNLQVTTVIPPDIINKAKKILQKHPHGTGAYSHSLGIEFIREAVAEFITRRDRIPSNKNHIFLTDGASKGVQNVILSLLKNENDGILIPIPQYPLYSATLTLYGGHQIPYYLDETHEWSLNEKNLETSIEEAKKDGIHPVAIAVINPGNPTGAVLTEENIEMIIRCAKKYNLAILADEVYQDNIYEKDYPFHSFAKVLVHSNEKEIALFSFHSVSKGYMGECGHRGGYAELRNVPDDVLEQLIKLQSINLCSNIPGQLVTYLMLTPPQPADESYQTFIRERDLIINSLKERAALLAEGLNAIEGVSVDIPQGAMYAFVKFTLPSKGPGADAKQDEEYCLQLLEKTGICVVPGSGFGQQPGTMHFRITFLPSKTQLEKLVIKYKRFHEEYINKISLS